MRLKVVIVDLELSRLERRIMAAIAISVLVLAGGALAYAAVPRSWNSGDTLTAMDLNANFASLDIRVTAIETKSIETRNGKKYSLGATFCGTTAATNGQITGGYAGAKSLCEALAACGNSLSAHMCTGDEIVRSMAVGISPPTAVSWYSTGAYLQLSTTSGDDCIGWTDVGSNGAVGPTWGNGTGGNIAFRPCSNLLPVSCCD